MDFENRYHKLNKSQKEAVDTIEGPVQVNAGPGTGKTELLSMRAANILQRTDILPSNILCLTFTDSGATAMRDRLFNVIGKDAYKIGVYTFHSFGSDIINRYNDFFYNGAILKPADETIIYETIRAILDKLDYNNPLKVQFNNEYTYINSIIQKISDFKSNGLNRNDIELILKNNNDFINKFEDNLSSIFNDRVSLKVVDPLNKILEKINNYNPENNLPLGIMPLKEMFSYDLKNSIEYANTNKKTTKISELKKKWFVKNDIKQIIFKEKISDEKIYALLPIYESYISSMQKNLFYDFDDMILQLVEAVEKYPELKYNLQEQYQYIMVDEFQDTSLSQLRIIRSLADNIVLNNQPNILVVGDDDQSVYGFQGANINNILSFKNQYTNVKEINLRENYRSTKQILDLSRNIIIQADNRLENMSDNINKQLTNNHNNQSSQTRLLEANEQIDEYCFVADDIKNKINSGEKPSNIAIIARKHKELLNILPYLFKLGINVNYERRDNVLELEPIKLLVNCAKLLILISDQKFSEAEVLIPKIISHPMWGYKTDDIIKLSLGCYYHHVSWIDSMRSSDIFSPFINWAINLSQKVYGTPLEIMIDLIIGKKCSSISDSSEEDIVSDNEQSTDKHNSQFNSPFFSYFFNEDKLKNDSNNYLEYLNAITTLRSKLRDYTTNQTNQPTICDLVKFISLREKINKPITSIRPAAKEKRNAINLMTSHRAKGLEFNDVYIIDAIDSVWGTNVRTPNDRIAYPENLKISKNSGETIDDRLRLFYVACTRAKDNLTISYSKYDFNQKPTEIASFLIDTDLPRQKIPKQPDSAIELTELSWYSPIITMPKSNLKDLLQSKLDSYCLSATHLNNFIDIVNAGPKVFLLNNLLRFPESMNASSAFGSAIHSTLENVHSYFIKNEILQPIEEMFYSYRIILRQFHLCADDYNDCIKRGEKVLENFYKKEKDSFKLNQKVELNFQNQGVVLNDARLTGKLDLVDFDKKNLKLAISDYKTGKPLLSWNESQENNKIKSHKYLQQLMFYRILVENSHLYSKYKIDSLKLIFVEPSKMNDDIVKLSATGQYSEDDYERFKLLIQKVWEKIINLNLPDVSLYQKNYNGILQFENDLIDNRI